MGTVPEHIHPIFDQLLPREAKEELLGQQAKVVWFTGLSGSGKSTVAKGLEKALHDEGLLVQVLDGDNIRSGINNNLGFSDEDRKENIRRIAEVAKLFLDAGVITLCSFVSPTHAIRDQVREIVGEENMLEVFVDASFEECEKRDVKGLYKKARSGEIKNFTGLDAPFERPENPAFIIPTAEWGIEESVDAMLQFLLPKIKR